MDFYKWAANHPQVDYIRFSELLGFAVHVSVSYI
jgi:hypothetical protein